MIAENNIQRDKIGCVICPDCYEIIDRHFYEFKINKNEITGCPECGCKKEAPIIDELIINIVAKLNKNGIKTYACCSGHVYTNDGYILFSDEVYAQYFIDNLQNNKKILIYELECFDEYNVLRWKIIGTNYIQKLKSIINSMIEIEKVSNKLIKEKFKR